MIDAGTNHELVTQRYIEFHRLNAEIVLIEDLFEGLVMIDKGEAGHLVQVAVHPDCADVVARGHCEYGIHIMDTFISPSRELAILTRREVEVPRFLVGGEVSSKGSFVPHSGRQAMAASRNSPSRSASASPSDWRTGTVWRGFLWGR